MNIILEKLKLFIIYSSASAIYAAANVEKIKACTEPAKIPSNIIGNGITNGTREVNTVTVSSSANTLPNNRKLNDIQGINGPRHHVLPPGYERARQGEVPGSHKEGM